MALRRAILGAALAALLPASAPSAPAQTAPSENVVFAAWNVRNYRLEPSRGSGAKHPVPTITDATADAVAAILSQIAPDIVGLCEIGSRKDLADLQRRLEKKGIVLPHATWVDGADEDRHLALLSRFPIASTSHETRATVETGAADQRVQRGFLDCTIEVRPGFPLRILGAHFKSRRVAAGFDQAEVRRQESLVLRRHIESILRPDPAAALLVFGDLNDTKNSPSVAGLLGRARSPTALTLLALNDAGGENWTYRWAATDEYSRVDYVMVSNSLRPLVDRRASLIPAIRGWAKASDHRPLVVTLRIPSENP